MARSVNVPEITTAMVTSAYIDLLVDPDLFRLKNRPRSRRFFFVCSLITGSFIGASGYKFVGPALCTASVRPLQDCHLYRIPVQSLCARAGNWRGN